MKYIKLYEDIDFDDIVEEEYNDDIMNYIGGIIYGNYSTYFYTTYNKEWKKQNHASFMDEEIIDIKKISDVDYIYTNKSLDEKKPIKLPILDDDYEYAFITNSIPNVWTVLTDEIKNNIKFK